MVVFSSASEVDIPLELSPLQRYEIRGTVSQKACQCCLLAWVAGIHAALWGNSEMGSTDYHFLLCTEEKGEIFPFWSQRRVKIPSMTSLGCPFPSSFMSKGRGNIPMWAETSSSRRCEPWSQRSLPLVFLHACHLPQSRDIAYCWIMRHQRARDTASHLPMLLPDSQLSHLSSTLVSFKLSA